MLFYFHYHSNVLIFNLVHMNHCYEQPWRLRPNLSKPQKLISSVSGIHSKHESGGLYLEIHALYNSVLFVLILKTSPSNDPTKVWHITQLGMGHC